MRHLTYCPALLLAACTSQNPLFGLETETTTAGSSGHTTTTTPTTAGPTSNNPTTGEPPTSESATGESPGTDNPSAPLTSGTGNPGTTDIDPGATTGVVDTGNISTDSNDTDTGDSSTGEPACMLTKNTEFDERLHVDGEPKDLCVTSPMFFHGKLMPGNGALRFNTTDTGCPGEEKLGPLSLGLNYSLPVAKDTPCAKLYLFRDGDGPGCDIAQFFIVTMNPFETIVAGSFTPEAPAMNAPEALTVPEPVLIPCCPPEAQQCCAADFGDYALAVNGTEVLPGKTEKVMFNENEGRLYNIQYYESEKCIEQEPLVRHDWIGVRP